MVAFSPPKVLFDRHTMYVYDIIIIIIDLAISWSARVAKS